MNKNKNQKQKHRRNRENRAISEPTNRNLIIYIYKGGTKQELWLQSIQNLIVARAYTINFMFFHIQSNAAAAKGASRNPN